MILVIVVIKAFDSVPNMATFEKLTPNEIQIKVKVKYEGWQPFSNVDVHLNLLITRFVTTWIWIQHTSVMEPN